MSTTTPSFANSFWSADFGSGLGVLFSKLRQGVAENTQILTIARLRADAEEAYGQRLSEIEAACNRIEGGFQRDDGASVRKAYDGIRVEMSEAGRNHTKIAANVRELVVHPFGRWCEQHAARVQKSHDELQGRLKAYERQSEAVRQYRSAYFNKCRRVEDVDEEEKLAFQDPAVPSIRVEEDDEAEPIEIGDELYEIEQVKKMMAHALETVPLGEAKVPILGTYQNVSTGAEITEYIQKHMGATSLQYAEKVGQDLIANGFLRLVGNMGNTFANSSRMNYQWRPKAFQLTGIPERRPKMAARTATEDGAVIGDKVSEYLGGWNPLNNAHPNETPAEKLRREAREADERYKAAVAKLDSVRCGLEEAIVHHLKFMERCELDRLKAIKSVVLDFSGAVSNVIPSLQSSVDNMMLFQETVQPLSDLRYLLENYRTGSFAPKVVTYENYYHKVDGQTFGVDIEARARADRKRVPLIVTTILTFLDSHYPDLEGDEARRSIWTVEVPLATIHKLRAAINTGAAIAPETLEEHPMPVVAAALKLYLLELPDSLVSSHVYEIIKTIYTSTPDASARLQVIQSTLGQLRLANIATLDAVVTHFARLLELTNADEAYTTSLTQTLAPCILRPRVETGLSMAERFNARLLRDLLENKDAVFGELKRQSSALAPGTSNGRTRAISADESRRKEYMEERQRAIAAASHQQASQQGRVRAPSSGPVSHRRERSRGPGDTRFPVNASGVVTKGLGSPTHRAGESLGVPLSPPGGVSAGSRGIFQPPPTSDEGSPEGVGLGQLAAAAGAQAGQQLGQQHTQQTVAHPSGQHGQTQTGYQSAGQQSHTQPQTTSQQSQGHGQQPTTQSTQLHDPPSRPSSVSERAASFEQRSSTPTAGNRDSLIRRGVYRKNPALARNSLGLNTGVSKRDSLEGETSTPVRERVGTPRGTPVRERVGSPATPGSGMAAEERVGVQLQDGELPFDLAPHNPPTKNFHSTTQATMPPQKRKRTTSDDTSSVSSRSTSASPPPSPFSTSSGDEDPASKRLRLAEAHLSAKTLAASAGGYGFDAAEVDAENLRRRISESLHPGRIKRSTAETYNWEDIITCRARLDGGTTTACASVGSRLYAAQSNGALSKWEVISSFDRDGKKKLGVKRRKYFRGERGVICLAASPRGGYLVAAGEGRNIHVHDVETLERLGMLPQHRDCVTQLVFSQDGREMFSASKDRTVKVWACESLPAYADTLFGHQDGVLGLAALAREKCISVGARDRTVRLWVVGDETQMVFLAGQGGSVDCVALLDEETFVTGSENGAVALWSARRKKAVYVLERAHGVEKGTAEVGEYRDAVPDSIPQARWVTAIAALPYSDLFVSGSWDGCVRVWRVRGDRRACESVATLGNVYGVVNSLEVSDAENGDLRIMVAVGKWHRLGRWRREPIPKARNEIVVFEVRKRVMSGDLGEEEEEEDETETGGD
ncbi:hypothetical protein K470DRAFT_261942 [Piedraia hortae CBS 480.64]|uniref:RhoGAP-domain-containing protein n=1 Tax=Piedraia hortae CBS 480.64 TaxID=1314780 RepID=A0A6A7C8I3_9PEZI|nr:hypothetical protein K470DRAFT_261942 [Piedraia hortae CBS 480.64]